LKDQEITSTDVVAGNGDGGKGDSVSDWGSHIIIVVTHVDWFEGGRLGDLLSDTNLFASDGARETRRLYCLFNETNGFAFGLLEATGRVDGLLGEADLGTFRLLVAGWWVDGGTGDTNFFAVGWEVLGRVDG
jgi:hypothetical protein